MSKFQSIKKAYGVNEKLLKEGVWLDVPNTNVAFLLRPATAHNKEFMKKNFDANLPKKYGDGWENKILFDDKLRSEFADIYFGTVIMDYRYTDGSPKDAELQVEDIIDLFIECPMVLKDLSAFVIEVKNFQVFSEEEAKN